MPFALQSVQQWKFRDLSGNRGARAHPNTTGIFMSSNDGARRRSAWNYILLVGIVNLFADMTYEGARGIPAIPLEQWCRANFDAAA